MASGRVGSSGQLFVGADAVNAGKVKTGIYCDGGGGHTGIAAHGILGEKLET